jgi:hypothetical protein
VLREGVSVEIVLCVSSLRFYFMCVVLSTIEV